MNAIPSGRTSSVKAANKTFLVQTEFKLKPKTAIVTCVSLDGQVVHRVERIISRPMEDGNTWSEAESAIKSQQDALAKKIIANSRDFIKQTKSINISRLDKLNIVPGISYIANVDEKLQEDDPHTIFIQSKLIAEIGDAIGKNSRNGRFNIAAILTDQGKYILDRLTEDGFIMTLKNDAEIGNVIKNVIDS
jgi:hypothetical protein